MQIISLHCNLATVQTDQAVNLKRVFAAGPIWAADSNSTSAGQLTTISQAFLYVNFKYENACRKENSYREFSCNF